MKSAAWYAGCAIEAFSSHTCWPNPATAPPAVFCTCLKRPGSPPAPFPCHVTSWDSRPKGGIASAVKALGERTKGADALFLASPGLANQVQPALTYYGLHIPLFSLSSAWEPAADTASLQDLEGLGFCGLPWLLDDTRPRAASPFMKRNPARQPVTIVFMPWVQTPGPSPTHSRRYRQGMPSACAQDSSS
jgi:hypothetical protein